MLRNLIEQNGLKQTDVARLGNVSVACISLICAGKRNMSPKLAKKIAPALHVNWWELV